MGLTIASTFFITPLVVHALQRELYGVWSFLNGLLAYADLLYLGLGGAFVRYVAMHRAGANQAEVNRLASIVLGIYVMLGLASLAAFSTLGLYVGLLFAQPLTAPALASVATACTLLGVQLFFNFVSSGFAGILYGSDRIDLINAVRILSIAGRAMAILIWLDGDHPLVTLAWITAGGMAFEALGLAVVVHRVDRALVLRPSLPTWPELRTLYAFGLKSFAIVFATTLISYTDTTVIGIMMGAASVAVYTLPLQLIEYVRMAAIGVAGALLPRLAAMVHRGDAAGLRDAYVRASRFVLFMATFATAQLIALGPAFLTIWVGREFGADVQWVIVCLGLAALLHILAVVIPYGFYQAMDVLGTPAKLLVVEALANACLSVLLAPRFGLLGVAIGTLIPAVAVSAVLLPAFLSRRLAVPARVILAAAAPSAALLLVVTGTHWSLGPFVGMSTYAALAGRVVLTCAPSFAVFWFLFPAGERRWVTDHVLGLMGRRTT